MPRKYVVFKDGQSAGGADTLAEFARVVCGLLDIGQVADLVMVLNARLEADRRRLGSREPADPAAGLWGLSPADVRRDVDDWQKGGG